MEDYYLKQIRKKCAIPVVVWRSEQLKPIEGDALTALNDAFKKAGKLKPTLKNRL